MSFIRDLIKILTRKNKKRGNVMENINELIKQYKKYVRLADYEYNEFQRTHNDDHMTMVDEYSNRYEEIGKQLKELGIDTNELYMEAMEYTM